MWDQIILRIDQPVKALILAGGRGTRLRPLTNTRNKHLLPVANQPMIMRIILDAIDLGIKEIIININEGDTELPRGIGNGRGLGVKIRYIEQKTPNGMMFPIKIAQDLIGDDEFLFSAGDNILAGGLEQHYRDFRDKGSQGHVLVVKRPDYQNFGVAVTDGDRLVDTIEKPKEFISDLVLTAIYFFTPAVFDAFDQIEPIDPKGTGIPEYYPPPVINWMIGKGYKFTASEVTGWWKDTGQPEDLLGANAFALDKKEDYSIKGEIKETKLQGRIDIAKGSEVINSSIRGPVVVGNGVTIENSYIGPYTSIGNGCTVKNSMIENSILMEGSTVSDVSARLENCILGSDSEVLGGSRIVDGNSLMLGDNCKVLLNAHQ